MLQAACVFVVLLVATCAPQLATAQLQVQSSCELIVVIIYYIDIFIPNK